MHTKGNIANDHRLMLSNNDLDGRNSPHIVNHLGMDFVYIRPGVFQMGSPDGQALFSHEKQIKSF